MCSCPLASYNTPKIELIQFGRRIGKKGLFMLRAPIGFARWPSQTSALEKRKVFEQSQPGLAIISVRCLKYKSFKCSIFYIF